MKVILQENVESLGDIGDIVSVKDGYARNYLLPRKKAVLADERNTKNLEHQKKIASHKKAKLLDGAKELAKRLQALSVTISKQAGENDKLYGSVTSMDIEDALRSEDIKIDRRSIVLDDAIKSLGVFHVDVKLHTDVVAKLKVWVVKKD